MPDLYSSLALAAMERKLETIECHSLLSLQLQVSEWWKRASDEERELFRGYVNRWSKHELMNFIPGEQHYDM